MLNENIFVLKDVPLCAEQKPGKFSSEDKPNTSIPSGMEPLLYELWPRFTNLLQNVCARVLFSEHLGELMLEFERAMSKRRLDHLAAQVEKLVTDNEYLEFDVEFWKMGKEEVKHVTLKYL